MKCVYVYSHPVYPQATATVIALNPLQVDELDGNFIEVEVAPGAFETLRLELDHFTLLTSDREAVEALESTSVDFGLELLFDSMDWSTDEDSA